MISMKHKILTASLLLIVTGSAGVAMAGSGSNYPAYTPDLLPPNPNAGMCYARVEIPAEYTNTTERVMVEEGYRTVEAVQGQLVPGQERVMVKEPSIRFDVRQPRFSTVPEKVLVRPSYQKLYITKPEFETVSETVNSGAPTLVWKRGNPGKLMAQGYKIHSTADGGVGGAGYSSLSDYSQSSAGATRCGDSCEIWCLVEEPTDAVTFNRRVMKTPGNVRRESVPAKYETIMKQVVSDPGGVREVPVPAEFKMVNVERVAQIGSVREVNVPPKFGTVAKKQLVSPARYEWKQVVCKPGTGSIRSSQSYAEPVTPAIVTPIPSQPSYTTSSYTPHQPITYGGGAAHHQSSCGDTSCRSAGEHGLFEGRSRSHQSNMGQTSSYGGSVHNGATQSASGTPSAYQSGRYGTISPAYELPEVTSDNLGGYSNPVTRHTGAKRTRW